MARDGDAAVAHHLLEEVLVHRERGAGDAGADVRDAGELEQSLDGAVLAERAVEDRQHDVDGAERGERSGLGGNGQRLRRTSRPQRRPGPARAAAPGSSAQRPSRPIATLTTS